jgi:hypothetical protein
MDPLESVPVYKLATVFYTTFLGLRHETRGKISQAWRSGARCLTASAGKEKRGKKGQVKYRRVEGRFIFGHLSDLSLLDLPLSLN